MVPTSVEENCRKTLLVAGAMFYPDLVKRLKDIVTFLTQKNRLPNFWTEQKVKLVSVLKREWTEDSASLVEEEQMIAFQLIHGNISLTKPWIKQLPFLLRAVVIIYQPPSPTN